MTEPTVQKKILNEIVDTTIVDRICKIVNVAIEADPSAMKALFENRVPCNQRLADDPEIQVVKENEEVGYTIGLLGLLSGIAGTRTYKDNDHFSKIWAVYNVDCPLHGTNEEKNDLVVGDTCSEEGCEEKLVLGDLLRVEQVPTETD